MRLIDADALSQEIESLRVTVSGRPATLDDAKSDVLRVIDEQKTVDAAPVVPGLRLWCLVSGLGQVMDMPTENLYTICGRVQSAVMMLTVRTKNHNGDSDPAAARRWMEAMTYA